MLSGLKIKNILKYLIIFSYISATVIIMFDNDFTTLRILIPLIISLFIVNFSREYWLYPRNKPASYTIVSIILETILILIIGSFDKSSVHILFFYVMLSSMVLMYPLKYSVLAASTFIVAEFSLSAVTKEIPYSSMLSMGVSLIVSSVFVIGMSHLVKMQINEKEKQARINSELEQAYKMLIENSAAVQKLAIEEERTRMAREIHDTLAHTLTTLIVQLEACKKLAGADPSRLPGELEKAQELSRSGFNDIKRSIKALRPKVMEDKSLLASVTTIINEVMENTGVKVTLHSSLPQELKLSTGLEVAIFRAIQESITNSIRHGHATDVRVNITQVNGSIEVIVEDNGLGCTNIKAGYGLKGIMERINALNGKAEFTSSNRNGFKTIINVPTGN